MRQRDKLQAIGRIHSRARRQRPSADGTSRSETFTLDGGETDVARPALIAYCETCQARRGVHDWHDRGEVLLVDLEPCGHVAELTARLEWLPYAVPEHTRVRPVARARVAGYGR